MWNVWGLNGLKTQRQVLNLMKQERPNICILVETKIKAEKEDDIMRKFLGWRCINNYEHHYKGRIWVLYKEEDLKVTIYQKSK